MLLQHCSHTDTFPVADEGNNHVEKKKVNHETQETEVLYTIIFHKDYLA